MKIIKNANIYTMEENIINGGNIWIKEGKIFKIDKEKDLPIDAEIIDVNGAYAFPGFIDAHTHLGMWEDGMGFEGADGNEETDPVTPHLRAIDAINPMDNCFKEAYEAGVTSVATGPGSANVIAGTFIAIKTYGKRVDDMIIKDPIAMKIAFGENPKSVYGKDEKSPQTRMAIASLLRENLKKAKDYLDEIEKSKVDEDYERPEYDIRLEALLPVLKKEMPFKVHAHRADDIFTAIRIAKEFDVNLTLDHCTEGYLIHEELEKEYYPILLGPVLSDRSKIELKNQNTKAAGILQKSGLEISLITDHPVIPIQYLPICAAIAVKEGMDSYAALKAITINPAKALQIDDKVGSLSVGKDADIVIMDDIPFNIQSRVLYTFINGKIVFKH